MADFDLFSRGDLIYKGAVLAEVTNGRVHVTNGSAIVKTLRRGVAGSHKGTAEATASFTQAVIKTGMKEDFLDVVMKSRTVRLTVALSDSEVIEVQGIIQAADFTFAEAGMVTGDFAVTGRPKKVA